MIGWFRGTLARADSIDGVAVLRAARTLKAEIVGVAILHIVALAVGYARRR